MSEIAPQSRRANLAQRIAAVSRLGIVSGGALRHVLQKLVTVTIGAASVSDLGRRLRQALDRDGNWPPLHAAIVAHAFYPDLIGEILRCRDFLPAGTPIIITVPHERMNDALLAVAGAQDVTLVAVQNRGRDIAPFLSVLASGALDSFDAVLKVHTKRSPHLLDGEIRRKLLFDRLCGDRRGARRVLGHFLDPATGMLGWGACFRTAPPYWMGNRERVESLSAMLGLPGPAPLGFFEGSMFWFRPQALRGLTSLALDPQSFEPEAGQIDGALHHAVERLFTIAVWQAGYCVSGLDGRVLIPG